MSTLNPAFPGGKPYRVPEDARSSLAVAAAVFVHIGLLAFLWIGVHWQNTAPVAVEAEIWDLQTRTAAAPLVPEPESVPTPTPTPAPEPIPTVEPTQPAPPPRAAEPVEPPPVAQAPDIRLERARIAKEEKLRKALEMQLEKKLAKEKAAKDKVEQAARELVEQKAKALAEKKKVLADKKLAEQRANAKQGIAEQRALDKAREADLQRMNGALGSGGAAAKSTAPRSDGGYAASVTAKIKANIAYSGSLDMVGNPRAIYRIEQLPTGDISSIRKLKSSGVPAYDTAVENAINKSSPLPRKKDGTVERTIEATFDMKELP